MDRLVYRFWAKTLRMLVENVNSAAAEFPVKILGKKEKVRKVVELLIDRGR